MSLVALLVVSHGLLRVDVVLLLCLMMVLWLLLHDPRL